MCRFCEHAFKPAKFYRRLHDFGAIRKERIAGLILLEGNPLEDIRNTRGVAGVIADGRYISQEELAQLRSRLKKVAAIR